MKIKKRSYVFVVTFLSMLILLSGLSWAKEAPEEPEFLLDSKAIWHMDEEEGNIIFDAKGKYSCRSNNTQIVEGPNVRYFNNARYFNGTDSYIQTPLSFEGWMGITISLWVKPEPGKLSDLAIILDNGHDAQSNFVIQSTDNTETMFIWHCSGAEGLFELPHDRWTHLVVVADAKEKKLEVYLDGLKSGETEMPYVSKLGSTPLTFGKWATRDARYFKGAISEVMVWDQVLKENEIERLSDFYKMSR